MISAANSERSCSRSGSARSKSRNMCPVPRTTSMSSVIAGRSPSRRLVDRKAGRRAFRLVEFESRVDPPTAVQHTKYLHAFTDAVENQVVFRDEMPNPGTDILSGYAGPWMLPQLAPAAFDRQNHTHRGGGIGPGDMPGAERQQSRLQS